MRSAKRAFLSDGAVDTLSGVVDLAIMIGEDPEALLEIAEQLYENPEILLEGMAEPFKDRYKAGDIAGAVGYALPALAEVVIGTKGTAAGTKAGVSGAKGAVENLKAHFDISTNSGVDLPTPVVVSNMLNELTYTSTSGVKLVADPNKTTTVLGNYGQDMQHILSELGYPKTLDFGAKNGGFNVLNTPDSLYTSPTQFWNDYNKPFLDAAIERGDNFPLATAPTPNVLINESGLTGFGREIEYLQSHGYTYDAATSSMVK